MIFPLSALCGAIAIAESTPTQPHAEKRTYTVCELNALGSKAEGLTVRVSGVFIQAAPHGTIFMDPKCKGPGMELYWPQEPPRDRSIENFERAADSQMGVGSIELELNGNFSWQPPDEDQSDGFAWKASHGRIDILRVWWFTKTPY